MKIGTYYYPEQWPVDQWERDFDNIARMGLQIVHMSEFAWFSMEPSPGDFRFDWLHKCVDMAARRKLDVILCTPTAAPPIWLTEQHPDVLPMDRYGARQRHGGRRHYSPTSLALHEATTRIVTRLAEEFSSHPSLIGWQIDNEYSANYFDQNAHCHAAFRAWLQRKYGDVATLNAAWGNQFWNQYYTSFDQILMPPERDPEYRNPHHALDGARFWSWAFADYNKLQADILKAKMPAEKANAARPFITTNFIPFQLDVNPVEMADDLSLYSWDAYPVSGHGRDHKDEKFRIASPSSIGLYHDFMRDVTGRWGLMELQPGQVNWSGVPVLLYPNVVRLWIWTAYAHGAEFVTTYRFRQPRFGVELFHLGLVGTDGVTPSPGGRQFQQTIEEMRRLKHMPTTETVAAKVEENLPTLSSRKLARRKREAVVEVSTQAPVVDRSFVPAEVGLMIDFDQLWYFRTLPQARRWDYSRLLQMWYAAITRLGMTVRMIDPKRDWPAGLSMIVAPGMQMVDDALIKRWETYANGGGNLVLTCRTGLMDRAGQLWEGPLAKPILHLIGANIEAYDGLPDDTFGQIEMDGQPYKWGVWGDLLFAPDQTRVLAKYADQFYAGVAAVTQQRFGKGVVTYCGVFSEGDFTSALLNKITQSAGLPIIPLPDRTQLLRRDGFWIFLNYNETPVDAPAHASARFIIGTRHVEPAGVAVWE